MAAFQEGAGVGIVGSFKLQESRRRKHALQTVRAYLNKLVEEPDGGPRGALQKTTFPRPSFFRNAESPNLYTSQIKYLPNLSPIHIIHASQR